MRLEHPGGGGVLSFLQLFRISNVFLFCRREEFMHWVEMLPDTQTPSWLGLPSNAEKVLLTTQGAIIYPLCLSDCHGCIFCFMLIY